MLSFPCFLHLFFQTVAHHVGNWRQCDIPNRINAHIPTNTVLDQLGQMCLLIRFFTIVIVTYLTQHLVGWCEVIMYFFLFVYTPYYQLACILFSLLFLLNLYYLYIYTNHINFCEHCESAKVQKHSVKVLSKIGSVLFLNCCWQQARYLLNISASHFVELIANGFALFANS
jgi:hypothetical protein